jgi:2-polyprenyl-3-methyl-5-hydroxy-6-metoxy-1,4-benzoquinol methylase
MAKNKLAYISGSDVSVSCDLCGSQKTDTVVADARDNDMGIPGRFAIVQCSVCGFVYLNPRPDARRILAHYPREYGIYHPDNWLVAGIKNFLRRGDIKLIARLTGGQGRVLDVGCGLGELLGRLGASYEKYGLEMDKASADVAGRLSGARVWRGQFESFVFPENAKFDVVIMRYLFEHLPSPMEALRKLRSIISDKGFAVISVPNYDSIERRVFGRYWHGYEIPRHFSHFSADTMRQFAEHSGFELVEVRYSAVPNDWVNSLRLLLKAKGFKKISKFFTIKNIPLVCLFLPFSLLSYVSKKSSRITFILSPAGWDSFWTRPEALYASEGPSLRHKMRHIERNVNKYAPDAAELLDVGCGSGALLGRLSRRKSLKLHGSEISSTGLQLTSKAVPTAELFTLNIERDFLPKKFDIITCTNVLEEITNDTQALQNMSAMLNPGGLLFVVVPHSMRYWTVKDQAAQNKRRYDVDELTMKCKQAGLAKLDAYTWGWPLFSAYYNVMVKVNQDRIMGTARRKKWIDLLRHGLFAAMFVDDLFIRTSRGRVLIGVFKKGEIQAKSYSS